MEGFILRAHLENGKQPGDHRRRVLLGAVVLAMLIAAAVLALWEGLGFAEVSPGFRSAAVGAKVDDPGVQLAQADLPPGVGSLDDYVREGNEDASRGGAPPQGYSSQAMPPPGYSPQYAPQPKYYPQDPQSYYPQGVPSQEWNNGYADPNAARSALIGAAVVGALAVGLWAYQQHEIHQAQIQQAQQAQRRASKRLYRPKPAYADQIE